MRCVRVDTSRDHALAVTKNNLTGLIIDIRRDRSGFKIDAGDLVT